MAKKRVIAIDLGATSGRLMEVAFDGTAFEMTERHRFPNEPVMAGKTLYWDALRLWHEITLGLDNLPEDVASIGVDTWGVDTAFLDRNGTLIANPAHYRDERTNGAMEWAFERVPRREIFERTGIQFIQFNGIFQLASMVRDDSPLLDVADTMLTMPDLFNYWLTGEKSCEFTDVTTLQLYNPSLGDWDRELMERLGIPTHFLTPIVQPGTKLGTYNGTPVIAPACHDTGSAVVSVPTVTENYAYLSSGTWSLLGIEVDTPVISDASYEANVTNEGGFGGSYRLLKNIMGLWLLEQSLQAWRAEGRTYTYDEINSMIAASDPFYAMFDPDDPVFLPIGDIPSRVCAACGQGGQPVPETDAQIATAIYTSLSMKYRYVLDLLERVSGNQVDRLHVIGGGSQNGQLCQMAANAIGRPVYAGPVEATAMGNAIVQFIALGELADLNEARTLLSSSVGLVEYTPQDAATWEEHYQRYRSLVS